MNQCIYCIQMVYVLENITDYTDTIKSLIGNKCLSKDEITNLDKNKLKLNEYEDILNYVCSCDKLNIINPSVIYYLDTLQNSIFNFESNKINNYIKVRFPNYYSSNSLSNEYERRNINNYSQLLRIKLFMANEMGYTSMLNLNTNTNINVREIPMFLIKPTSENSDLLECFQNMTFLKESTLDTNMYDNTLNYISTSSKYIIDFANNVNIDTSTCPAELKVEYDTVYSAWFMLHFNRGVNESINFILVQSLKNNDYYFLEYVWGYSYTNTLHVTSSVITECAKYVDKLNPFYSAGYSKVDPTFFDYMYQVALNSNCITPEFISFISIRKLMMLINDKTIDHRIFKQLFKSTYKNLHIKHKLHFIAHAAKESTLRYTLLINKVIYPFIHEIENTENMIDKLQTFLLPLGDFFYYTELRGRVPSPNTDESFPWVCSSNKLIITSILTGGSDVLREMVGKDYVHRFKI